MLLVVGTRHAANACHVGCTWVLEGACCHGSMVVVEGHVIGAGDLTYSQWVVCWACMAVGGCSWLWANGCGERVRCWWWGLIM